MKEREIHPLWPSGAPHAKGEQSEDIPSLTPIFPTSGATGASVIVCPGGGYQVLADYEGIPVAEWLAKNGIAGFVLRYRLAPKYHHPCQMLDVHRAIRTVRAKSAGMKLDPNRIGILGFSAGGHLTSIAATHFAPGDETSADPIERASSRPDLQVLIYPVITMGGHGHSGSRANLLGDPPTPELIEYYSSEKQVKHDSPPAFLTHSTMDHVVPPFHSDAYAHALSANGILYEYVRVNMGDHGGSLMDPWTIPCLKFLRSRGF
jgi:acetyl esterase/lipase